MRKERREPGVLPGDLLESELSCELHNASVAIAGHFAKSTRGRGGANCLYIRVVHRIERLRTELEVQPLVNAEVTIDAKVKAVEAGALDGSALGRCRNGAVLGGCSEGTRIEPRFS